MPTPLLRKKPSLDFSFTGLIYTAMMLFMGLAAINSQANLLFAVFGLMIGVLLVSGVVSRLVLRKLVVRRYLPEHGVAGQLAALQYVFENRKRFWPSFSVTIHEIVPADAFTTAPQAYLLHAAGGTSATVPMFVVPRRRGVYALDRYQLATSFPFGFIKRAVDRRHTDTLLVYPPLAEVDPALLALCISAETSGARQKPRRGGYDEVYGVKEYRPGENPRLINWKRSARTGTLVSKEMSAVAPPRVLILVDTHAPDGSPPEHRADVERCIAMAASLVWKTIDQNLALGLYCWSDGWVHLPPNRGKRHAHEMLALLAKLPANPRASLPQLLEGTPQLLRHDVTPILFTPGSPTADATLGDQQARGNLVVVRADSDEARAWFRFPPDVTFSPPALEPAT